MAQSDQLPGARAIGTGLRHTIAFALAIAACAPALTPDTKPTPGPVVILTQERTQSNPSCAPGHVEGSLVADARWGLALTDATGRTTEIIWPNGFAGGASIGGYLLLGSGSEVVGRTGDMLEIGGEFRADGAWLACGEVRRIGP